MRVLGRRLAIAWVVALASVTSAFATTPPPVAAAETYPCLGAPAGEPAGGQYPEPRIFFESQSWWTEVGEPFPGRHIHTGACIPWMQPVDGVVQYHVRNLLHEAPGTESYFRLQIWKNGGDPTLQTPMTRSCASRDCAYWDSFTVDYAPLLPGRWEHRFTHNVPINAYQARQFTTTRWHICIRTCAGGTTEAYTKAVGAAGWYQGLDYANAFLDPDDYIRLRDGVTQGLHSIKVKFDQGAGSVTVDPDAHNGNPGIVMCRIGPRQDRRPHPRPDQHHLVRGRARDGGRRPADRQARPARLQRRRARRAGGRPRGALPGPGLRSDGAPRSPTSRRVDPAAWRRPACPSAMRRRTRRLRGPGTSGTGVRPSPVSRRGAHVHLPRHVLHRPDRRERGRATTATRTVAIAEPPPLVSVFDVTPTSGVAPLTVMMTDRLQLAARRAGRGTSATAPRSPAAVLPVRTPMRARGSMP